MELRLYTSRHLEEIKPLKRLSAAERFAMRVVATVLPFRVNQYVIDQLIDWDNIPADPLFKLCFPQPQMLIPRHFEQIATLLETGADRRTVREAVRNIHQELNPHPAEQLTLNVPRLHGTPLKGVQHKYLETVLFFPSQGQSCFSYCTFCFRWPQFVGDNMLRIAAVEGDNLQAYLKGRPEVTDLLVTGGDPLVMNTKLLERYLTPFTRPELAHVQTIRIGTKALSYWPYRFTTGPDADALLRLFERLVAAGRHVALMVHFNHWREMEPAAAHEAIRRIQATGAVIRSQAPLLAHINDDPAIWRVMWKNQVRLGLVPYYMFVVRDTGARCYFEVPLVRAWEIFRQALQQVSGLARTVRGPSMSTGPGKIEIQGAARIKGEQVLVLRFIQGRNPAWVQQPFFAACDPAATWFDQLRPASGEEKFFFADEYAAMRAANLH